MTTVEQRGRSLHPGGDSEIPRRQRSASPNPLFRREFGNHRSMSYDLRHPVCEGYLYKQGHIANVFNKRYFVLYPAELIYYKSATDFEHDKAKDKLSKKTVEMKTDGLYLTKPDKKPKGGKFAWILHLPHPLNHRKEMLLVASTKEDRHRWMTKLQSVNPNLHPHSDTPYDTPENSPFPHHREPPKRSITTSSEDHDTLCVVEHSDEECPHEDEEQACQTNSDSTDSEDHTPKTNKDNEDHTPKTNKDNEDHTPERNENKDNHASETEKDNKETSKTESDKESESKTTQ